jgi:hypothetical protein
MTPEKGRLALTEELRLETILDNACQRLQDKQVTYSIRKLQELDLRLEDLERELDNLVCRNTGRKHAE